MNADWGQCGRHDRAITNESAGIGFYSVGMQRRHRQLLFLLILKAYIHFTVPRRVESQVDIWTAARVHTLPFAWLYITVAVVMSTSKSKKSEIWGTYVARSYSLNSHEALQNGTC